MKLLTLGYSPCPNDTFIFHALVHGLIDTEGLAFRERLEDVETLNRMALGRELDVTKASFGAFGNWRNDYCLLRSGAALGRGCGPLVVSGPGMNLSDLKKARIAIPGELTTAFLLLRLFDPELGANAVSMPFNAIVRAVSEGRCDAGLIIHESRFTYHEAGLKKLVDLGEWWEKDTGLPIPLGGIFALRKLGADLTAIVERLIKKSLQYAWAHPSISSAYIKEHSQEIEEEVVRKHIDLYVNDFSEELGAVGAQAVEELLLRAETAGIVEKSDKPLFARPLS